MMTFCDIINHDSMFYLGLSPLLIHRHQHRCIRPNPQQQKLRRQAICEEIWSGHQRPWRPSSRRRTVPGWSSQRALLLGLVECTRTIAVSSRNTPWTAPIRATEHLLAPSTSPRLINISEYSISEQRIRARGIVLSFSSIGMFRTLLADLARFARTRETHESRFLCE